MLHFLAPATTAGSSPIITNRGGTLYATGYGDVYICGKFAQPRSCVAAATTPRCNELSIREQPSIGIGRLVYPRGPFGSPGSAGSTLGFPFRLPGSLHSPLLSGTASEQTCFHGLSTPTMARNRARPLPAIAHAVTTATSLVSRTLVQAGDSWIATTTAGAQSLSIRAQYWPDPAPWPAKSMWFAVVPFNQLVKPSGVVGA